jgi:hypothetical protein
MPVESLEEPAVGLAAAVAAAVVADLPPKPRGSPPTWPSTCK